jgi:uncharacterized membrane protein YbhN (UPF0104 family)
MKEQVASHFAYAYVRFLLVLEVLLFALSLLLHLSVFLGRRGLFVEFGAVLFRGTCIVGIPVTAFIKDSLRWTAQLKTCPQWMWRTALTLGGYGLLLPCLQGIFPEGASFSEQALTISGFPLGFDAIALCIIYSALWSGYLTESEVVKGAGKSLLMVSLGFIAFLAYRAGYLHHAKNY